MSISLNDPPKHVLPHAYDRSLTGYRIRLTFATLIAFVPVLVIAKLWCGEYGRVHTISSDSMIQGAIFLFLGPAMLFPVVMRPESPWSSESTLLPFAILRLARTPVGWALLREGAELSERRKGIKDLERLLPTFRGIMTSFNEPEKILEHEANLLSAWSKLLIAETDLVDRQRRHLAGEIVGYNHDLASAP